MLFHANHVCASNTTPLSGKPSCMSIAGILGIGFAFASSFLGPRDISLISTVSLNCHLLMTLWTGNLVNWNVLQCFFINPLVCRQQKALFSDPYSVT